MKTAMVSLLGLVVAFNSCRNIQEKLLPVFNVNIPAINLRIPPIPLVLDKEIPVGALRTPINMDSAIRANTSGTFGASAVHSVRVKSILITTLGADADNNLSNFESARIRIFTDTSSVDIATISFPQSAMDSLIITPTSSPDISKYLKGSTLAYNLYWKNRRPTKKRLALQIQITLDVQ